MKELENMVTSIRDDLNRLYNVLAARCLLSATFPHKSNPGKHWKKKPLGGKPR